MEWGVAKMEKENFLGLFKMKEFSGYQLHWFPYNRIRSSFFYVFFWFCGIKFLKLILKNFFLCSLRFHILNFVCMWNSHNLIMVMGLKQMNWCPLSKLEQIIFTSHCKKKEEMAAQGVQRLMSMNFDILALIPQIKLNVPLSSNLVLLL